MKINPIKEQILEVAIVILVVLGTMINNKKNKILLLSININKT